MIGASVIPLVLGGFVSFFTQTSIIKNGNQIPFWVAFSFIALALVFISVVSAVLYRDWVEFGKVVPNFSTSIIFGFLTTGVAIAVFISSGQLPVFLFAHFGFAGCVGLLIATAKL